MDTLEDNTTIKIATLTNSNLDCLTKESIYKLTVECDTSDASSKISSYLFYKPFNKSRIIGDSNTQYLMDGYDYYSYINSRNINLFNVPNNVHAFVDLGELSSTVIYTTDDLSNPSNITAYLDVGCTKQIRKWKQDDMIAYTLGTNTSIGYSDLSFNTIYELTTPREVTSIDFINADDLYLFEDGYKTTIKTTPTNKMNVQDCLISMDITR